MTWPAWLKASWANRWHFEDPPAGLELPCRIWTGAATAAGYGQVSLSTGKRGGETVYLHRFAWEQHNMERLGPDDGGHLCGRPPCFEPSHVERQSRAFNRGNSSSPRFQAVDISADDLAALADSQWLLTARSIAARR